MEHCKNGQYYDNADIKFRNFQLYKNPMEVLKILNHT
jgi:hypothetical protein